MNEIITTLVNHILLPDRAKDLEAVRKKLTDLGFYNLSATERENLIMKAHNKVAEILIEREKKRRTG